MSLVVFQQKLHDDRTLVLEMNLEILGFVGRARSDLRSCFFS